MNERKICPLCGFANGPKYHFCKNCGAALEPSGASKQPPVADVFFGEGTVPEYGPEEGAVDTAAAGKPGRPSSAVFGGRKGDPYDRKNQKLYCYEHLTCKISEIYEAPEGSN